MTRRQVGLVQGTSRRNVFKIVVSLPVDRQSFSSCARCASSLFSSPCRTLSTRHARKDSRSSHEMVSDESSSHRRILRQQSDLFVCSAVLKIKRATERNSFVSLRRRSSFHPCATNRVIFLCLCANSLHVVLSSCLVRTFTRTRCTWNPIVECVQRNQKNLEILASRPRHSCSNCFGRGRTASSAQCSRVASCELRIACLASSRVRVCSLRLVRLAWRIARQSISARLRVRTGRTAGDRSPADSRDDSRLHRLQSSDLRTPFISIRDLLAFCVSI